jgi:hypothetical protein
MIGRIDTKNPALPPKILSKVGEGVAEGVGKAIGTDDDLVLSKKQPPTKEEIAAAFERLEKAETRARGLSMGTLGALPLYKKALAEVAAAKEAIADMRKEFPAQVAAYEAGAAAEKAAQKQGFFDFVKNWGLFPAFPVPTLLWNLFKKD